MPPSLGSQSTEQAGTDEQLLLAIVGSVSVTCFTILFALLALFLIKKNFFHRRRTFTYQSGSVSAACPTRTMYPAPHVPARSRSRSIASSPDAARPHFHTERVRSPPLPMTPVLLGCHMGREVPGASNLTYFHLPGGRDHPAVQLGNADPDTPAQATA